MKGYITVTNHKPSQPHLSEIILINYKYISSVHTETETNITTIMLHQSCMYHVHETIDEITKKIEEALS